MSVGVTEAAVPDLAIAPGPQYLDQPEEVWGPRRGDLDGRCEVFKAVGPRGAGQAIAEDSENARLLCR